MMLIDAENMLGARARGGAVRARVAALRAAVGPVDHAVAAYSARASVEGDDGLDVTASVLAQDGVGVLRVDPAPQAADRALAAHARRVAADALVEFVVASGDGRFADLAALGPVEVTVWEGQPVAGRLEQVATRVVWVARPA